MTIIYAKLVNLMSRTEEYFIIKDQYKQFEQASKIILAYKIKITIAVLPKMLPKVRLLHDHKYCIASEINMSTLALHIHKLLEMR